MAWIPRYYYNTRTHTCKRFIYGGCQGNANNFETIAECKSSCMGKKPICIIWRQTRRPDYLSYISNSLTDKPRSLLLQFLLSSENLLPLTCWKKYLQGAKLCKPFFPPVFDFFKGKRVSKGVNPPYRF